MKTCLIVKKTSDGFIGYVGFIGKRFTPIYAATGSDLSAILGELQEKLKETMLYG
jgi:hypothetical protein